MPAIKLPPLNLNSINDWYVLLFHYPLLFSAAQNETLSDGIKVVYQKQ